MASCEGFSRRFIGRLSSFEANCWPFHRSDFFVPALRFTHQCKVICRNESRVDFLLLLIFCALFLGGCGNATAPPPGVSAEIFAVVTGVWKLRKLGADRLLRGNFKGDDFEEFTTETGQHVKFFLRMRASAYLAANPDKDAAIQSTASDYDKVHSFVSTYIGLDSGNPAPLIKGADNPVIHLDFKDILRVMDTDGPVSDSARLTQESKRWERAMNIVWRAAALEDKLWAPSFSEKALKELLDRRLRIVERMLYQVSQDIGDQGVLQPSAAAAHGPWPDGVRVRPFEYPILSAASYAQAIGAANIANYNDPPGKVWRKGFDGSQLYYDEDNKRRIRDAAKTSFVPASGANFVETYPYDVVPGGDAAKAVDALFTPSTNLWDRSWIYCDHVLAALHIESLRFGKRRREGNDNTFNAAVDSHPQGWARLRPLLPGSAGDPGLMADDASKPPGEPRFFSRGPFWQVQLGDHLVFWNSIMYGILDDGAWSLENAVVVGVDSAWTTQDVGDSVELMGHGTAVTSAGRFRRDVTVILNDALKRTRQVAKAAPGDNAKWLRDGAPLVKWSPFGENWSYRGSPQSPWWIRIPYTDTGNWSGRALGRDATLRTLPDAIEYDPAAGFSSAPPAAGGGPANACYFPLWVPRQQGKWKGYIARRKAGNIPATFELDDMNFAGGNIPGLVVPSEFVPGATKQQVYTVRPIVAP